MEGVLLRRVDLDRESKHSEMVMNSPGRRRSSLRLLRQGQSVRGRVSASNCSRLPTAQLCSILRLRFMEVGNLGGLVSKSRSQCFCSILILHGQINNLPTIPIISISYNQIEKQKKNYQSNSSSYSRSNYRASRKRRLWRSSWRRTGSRSTVHGIEGGMKEDREQRDCPGRPEILVNPQQRGDLAFIRRFDHWKRCMRLTAGLTERSERMKVTF